MIKDNKAQTALSLATFPVDAISSGPSSSELVKAVLVQVEELEVQLEVITVTDCGRGVMAHLGFSSCGGCDV